MATVSVAMAGGMWGKPHRGRAPDAAVSSSPQAAAPAAGGGGGTAAAAAGQQQQQEARRGPSSGGGGENAGGCRLSDEAPGNLHQRGTMPGLSEVARGGAGGGRGQQRRRRKGPSATATATAVATAVNPGAYRWDEESADREFDFVVVPPDGCNMSGSDSDDSDWSVGWFEPHPPDFVDSDDGEESFAVLVPSYRLPAPPAAAAVSPSLEIPGNSADRGLPRWAALLSSVSSHADPEYQKQLDLWLASLTS